MDDLTGKISEILSDPGALEQIMGLAGMLGQSQAKAQQPEKEEKKEDKSASCDMPFSLDQADMLQMAMKIIPIVNAYKRDDSTTRLLQAIRPFLSEQRQKKLDEALKILQIMRLIPLIKTALPGFDLF